MAYFSKPSDIRAVIGNYSQMKCLWLDTEVADCFTKKPRLSLIQVSHVAEDPQGEQAVVLDVLDQFELVAEFVTAIMSNPRIEKVFHNASFDLRYLGGTQATNVTCTLKMARKMPVKLLPVQNHKLKTLAEHFIPNITVDKSEQISDWGQRPLTANQLFYAHMDVVYLAQIHQNLLQLQDQAVKIDPIAENVAELSRCYQKLDNMMKPLLMERDQLKERLQTAMTAQKLTETADYQLHVQNRTTKKVSIAELRNLPWDVLDRDIQIPLSRELQEQLGDLVEKLSIATEQTQIISLKTKKS
jgi:ribonuclease D